MSSYDNRTLFAKVKQWAENNRWFVGFMVIVFISTTLSTFVSTLDNLSSHFSSNEKAVIAGVTIHNTAIPINDETFQDMPFPVLNQLEPPILDVKVVNNTEQPLVLDKIKITATQIDWQEESSLLACAILEPSGFHNVDFDMKAKTQSKEILISYNLEPKGVERFFISIAPNLEEKNFGISTFRLSTLIEELGGKIVRLESVDIRLELLHTCRRPSVRREFEILPESEWKEPRSYAASTSTNTHDSVEESILSPGVSGPEVISLQRALTDLDHYRGPIDGYYGPELEASVLRFQTLNNLEPTGLVDPPTIEAICKQHQEATVERSLCNSVF